MHARTHTHTHTHARTHTNPLTAIGNSILDCLQIHQLNIFTTMLSISSFEDLVNSTDAEITVFAPTDEAFAPILTLLNLSAVDEVIGSHIVNKTIEVEDLVQRAIFENLARSLLHASTVTFHEYVYNYNSQYYGYQPVRQVRLHGC